MPHEVIPELQELRDVRELAVSPYRIVQYLGLAVKAHGIQAVMEWDEYKDLRELHDAATMLFGFAKSSGKFNRWLRPGDDPPDVIIAEDEKNDGHSITLLRAEIKKITHKDPTVKNVADKLLSLIETKRYDKGTVLISPLDIQKLVSLPDVYTEFQKHKEKVVASGISQVWLIMKIDAVDHKYVVCEVFPSRQLIPDLQDSFIHKGASQPARISIGNYDKLSIPTQPYP